MGEQNTAQSPVRAQGDDRSRLNIWVPQKIYDELLVIKSHEGGSITDLVRQALRDYIKRYKQEQHLE